MESTTVALGLQQLRAESCFAYLIEDSGTREAALVDPRADRVAAYLRELEERGLRLRFVIETHTHADHLSGAAELRARTGAEILLSERAKSQVATRRLRDGDRLTLGSHTIEIIASPGHTDDSMSLLVNGAILTGDALLIGGAGRTDFQNGSPEALYETLHGRFAPLSGDLTVYPGHDYAGRTHSTLAQERQTNPLLQISDRNGFVSALRAGPQTSTVSGRRRGSRSRSSVGRSPVRRRLSWWTCACRRNTAPCTWIRASRCRWTRSAGGGPSCRAIASWYSSVGPAPAPDSRPRS
jgi:sulfur dioxygenase